MAEYEEAPHNSDLIKFYWWVIYACSQPTGLVRHIHATKSLPKNKSHSLVPNESLFPGKEGHRKDDERIGCMELG